MPGEPRVVPVVLVAAVAPVGRRLPLVLVVAEAVKHHDQRMVLSAARRRQGEVDVELGAVEARDLPQHTRTSCGPGALVGSPLSLE